MRLRVALYAVNGLGLGHLTRLMGLGRALRRLSPGCEILLLTSSEASHLAFREGFACLKVPSRAAARTAGWRRDTFLRVAQSAVWNALSTFDPHLLVVDTFPTGSLGELSPVLRWGCRKAFVLRAQKPEKAGAPAMQEALRCFDLVLIPHRPGEDARPDEVPTPPSVPAIWTGPMTLRDTGEVLEREQARELLGLPREGSCGLVSLGGGGDPDIAAARSLLRRALQAPILAPGGEAVRWFECAGPLESPAPPAPPSGEPAGEAVSVLRGVHPQMIYARAFDGALTAAGYNTTHENQTCGLPTVLWPFPRDVDDQHARARFLGERGRALVFEPDANTPDEPGRVAWGEQEAVALRALLQRLFEHGAANELRLAMSRQHAGTGQGSEAFLSPGAMEPDAVARARVLLEGFGASGASWSGNGTHVGAWALLRACGWSGPENGLANAGEAR